MITTYGLNVKPRLQFVYPDIEEEPKTDGPAAGTHSDQEEGKVPTKVLELEKARDHMVGMFNEKHETIEASHEEIGDDYKDLIKKRDAYIEQVLEMLRGQIDY